MNDISVIIPTYQHAKTIADCIESLLSQTESPKEIIVVDDGSTDDTAKVIAKFGDRVRYVFQENKGAPVARNYGAELSTGQYLLFCDADIKVRPQMLEKMKRALVEHEDASYAYCNFLWGKKLFRGKLFDSESLRQTNFIHTTSLVRKTDFPGFDPNLKRFQDWDLWLTMFKNGNSGFWIDEVLFDVQNVKGRKNISKWLPSFVYKIPWQNIGWSPKAVREYQNARDIISKKHNL